MANWNCDAEKTTHKEIWPRKCVVPASGVCRSLHKEANSRTALWNTVAIGQDYWVHIVSYPNNFCNEGIYWKQY